MDKTLKFISFILWLIRSFLSIWIHLGFRLIYGNQKNKLPPIKNQLLLQPATVIARRIRERQVILFFFLRISDFVLFRSQRMKLFKLISIEYEIFNRI